MYKEKIVELLNKALKDELSASIAYKCMSELTENGTLAEELLAHSGEEYGHYNRILSYVFSHGLEGDIRIILDLEVSNLYPKDTKGIIKFTQDLEIEAIEDYRRGALLARENDDLETEELFKGLMSEEQGHFDDLSRYNKERRELTSFKEYARK